MCKSMVIGSLEKVGHKEGTLALLTREAAIAVSGFSESTGLRPYKESAQKILSLFLLGTLHDGASVEPITSGGGYA